MHVAPGEEAPADILAKDMVLTTLFQVSCITMSFAHLDDTTQAE